MKAPLIICTLLIITANLAFAHGGRTNASGCHNDRKRGGYHCHNNGSRSYPDYESIKYDKLTVTDIQRALNKLGYNAGKADGLFGEKTKLAIKQFQIDNEIYTSGAPTSYLLERIKEKLENQSK